MQCVRDDRNEFLNQIEATGVTADLLDDDVVPEDLFYDRFRESLQDFYDVFGFSVDNFDILYRIAGA
jgi:hypothetical protein